MNIFKKIKGFFVKPPHICKFETFVQKHFWRYKEDGGDFDLCLFPVHPSQIGIEYFTTPEAVYENAIKQTKAQIISTRNTIKMHNNTLNILKYGLQKLKK